VGVSADAGGRKRPRLWLQEGHQGQEAGEGRGFHPEGDGFGVQTCDLTHRHMKSLIKTNKLQSVNHFHTGPTEGVTEAGMETVMPGRRLLPPQGTPLPEVSRVRQVRSAGDQMDTQIGGTPEHSHLGKYPVPFRTPF